MKQEKMLMSIAMPQNSLIGFENILCQKPRRAFGNTTLPEITAETKVNRIDISILAGKSMNEHSLHLNSLFTRFNKSEIITDIDYCNNPVSFLCAIEQKTYNVIFIDYHLEGVKLESLISFIRQQSPKCKIIVTSTPAELASADKESLSPLCTKCCHESFSDINFREIIEHS